MTGSNSGLPVGPAGLGIQLGTDIRDRDGWVVRDLFAGPGLDGPPGVLQGGLAAGVSVAIARTVDGFDAPVTSIEARLHAPTPLGRRLEARVRPAEQAATYDVETWAGDRLLVSATVELAGRDPVSHAHDLVELATVPLPEPYAQDMFPGCFVCGPAATHPLGQRLLPAWHNHESVSTPWVCDDVLGDDRGVVDPLLVAAVLDCPTVWASLRAVEAAGHRVALLAGYRVHFFADAPVMAPLRTVGRFDTADGRKIQARGGLVDEDGVVYATAAALQFAADDAPKV